MTTTSFADPVSVLAGLATTTLTEPCLGVKIVNSSWHRSQFPHGYVLGWKSLLFLQNAPLFYLVADGNAFAIEDDGYMFGAAVNDDGSVDWSGSYEFSPDEEDVEYVAHMCNLLKQAQQLSQEHIQEVFIK